MSVVFFKLYGTEHEVVIPLDEFRKRKQKQYLEKYYLQAYENLMQAVATYEADPNPKTRKQMKRAEKELKKAAAETVKRLATLNY